MRGQRTAGQDVHLERAHQALAIARLNPRGRVRIDAAKQRVQPFDPSAVGNALEPRAERGVARGPRKEPARQRSVVQAGAADQDRQAAARGDVADDGRRLARIPRRRVLLGRIGDVDQVMGNALAGGRRHLVGADVEAAVDGRRVTADDLAVEPVGERDAERALAGRGRTDDRDEPRRVPSRARERRARPPAPPARPAANSSPICCVRVGRIMVPGILVEVEGDREERAVVGILGRQRLRGIRRRQRVERRVVERVDVARAATRSAR